EDGVEHGGGELACLRVLLADVIAAEQRGRAVRDGELGAVRESHARAREGEAAAREVGDVRVPGDRAERQDDARAAEEGQLAIEERRAARDFVGGGEVR